MPSIIWTCKNNIRKMFLIIFLAFRTIFLYYQVNTSVAYKNIFFWQLGSFGEMVKQWFRVVDNIFICNLNISVVITDNELTKWQTII